MVPESLLKKWIEEYVASTGVQIEPARLAQFITDKTFEMTSREDVSLQTLAAGNILHDWLLREHESSITLIRLHDAVMAETNGDSPTSLRGFGYVREFFPFQNALIQLAKRILEDRKKKDGHRNLRRATT